MLHALKFISRFGNEMKRFIGINQYNLKSKIKPKSLFQNLDILFMVLEFISIKHQKVEIVFAV